MKSKKHGRVEVSVEDVFELKKLGCPTMVNRLNGICFARAGDVAHLRYLQRKEKKMRREAEETFILCL